MKSITCFILLNIIHFVRILAVQSADSSRGHYPLHVGNLWQYYTYDYVNGSIIYRYGWTTRVTGDTLMPDGKMYSVVQSDMPNSTASYYRQEGSLVQFDSASYYGQKTIYDFSKFYGDTLFVYPRPRAKDSIMCIVTFNDYVTIFGVRRLAWDFRTFVSNTSSFLIQTVIDGFGVVEEKGEAGEEWFLKGAIIDGVKYGTVTSVNATVNSGQPFTFTLFPNYPNPFNSSTTISFQLPLQQKVLLAIYDVLGRRVASLLNTELPSGFHRMRWNGKNDQGIDQPSGLYLIRLDGETGYKQIKILMVK